MKAAAWEQTSRSRCEKGAGGENEGLEPKSLGSAVGTAEKKGWVLGTIPSRGVEVRLRLPGGTVFGGTGVNSKYVLATAYVTEGAAR